MVTATDFYCDEVLSGRTRVDRVIESVGVLAFRNTRPSFETHIMVVPKRHISSLIDPSFSAAEAMEVMEVLRSVAAVVIAATGSCRVVANVGDYQHSKHLHWHVISGGRLDSGFPWP